MLEIRGAGMAFTGLKDNISRNILDMIGIRLPTVLACFPRCANHRPAAQVQ